MTKHLLTALCAAAATLLFPAHSRADGQGPTLYGTQYSPSSALVAFAPGDPSAVTTALGAQDDCLVHGSVAAFDGKTLYVFTPRANSSTGTLTRLTFTTYTLDAGQWTPGSTRQLTASYDNCPNAMAYDPSTGNLYGYRNGGPTTLYTIDKQTGGMTAMRSLEGYYTSIAFDKDGACYAFDFDSQLNKLDILTGKATVVGSTGQSFADKQPTCIDAQTGTMYWVLTKTSASTLFTVSTATGQATRVGDMGNDSFLSDIFAVAATTAADAQAPDAPTALSVAYPTPGSLTATLTATAPVLGFDKQQSLTGNVALSFYVDDSAEPAATVADVAPGQEASATVSFAAEGEHRVRAVASNANGAGPGKTVSTWAGFDTPSAPAAVSLAIASDGQYTLTWEAPAQGTHGGAVKKEGLKYVITEYPSATPAGETTQTSFSGKIGATAYASYTFGVKAVSGDLTGDEGMSNAATFGDFADIPFYDDFTDSSTFGLYTIVNANGGATWEFGSGNVGKAAIYNGMNSSAQADDYLILPPMKLVEGVTYTVAFQAASGFNQDAGNNLDVLLLDGTEGTTAKGTLGSYTNIADYTAGLSETTCTYTATANATARLAFRCRSNAGKKLCLYSVYVTAEGFPDGPADVSDLFVEAGEKGAHEATVIFTAPVKDVKGNALTAIDHISVYRDAARTATHTFHSVEPGDACDWTDTGLAAGTHSYRVVAYTDKGASSGQTVSVLVGQDVPTVPLNLKITEQDDAFLLTWDAPKGAVHGGYIDYADIAYSVYYSYGLMENPELYQSDIKECRLSVPKSLVDGYASAHQILLTFLVLAETENGYSSPTYADIVYGAPYGLPFSESFQNGYTDSEPWGVMAVGDSYIQSWSMITGTSSKRPLDVEPVDGDNGMAMFYHGGSDGYEARLLAPQVSVEGASSPVLTLSVYHINSSAAENSTLTVEQQFAGSETFSTVGQPISVKGETGWQQHKLALPTDGGTRFRIVLHGKADALQPIFVDGLTVTDEELSAISRPTASTGPAAPVYDLQGRRVSVPASKGIYIQGGRKFVVR